MGLGPQFHYSGNAPKFSAPIFLVEEKTPKTLPRKIILGDPKWFLDFFLSENQIPYHLALKLRSCTELPDLTKGVDFTSNSLGHWDVVASTISCVLVEKFGKSFATIAPCVFFSADDAFFCETTGVFDVIFCHVDLGEVDHWPALFKVPWAASRRDGVRIHHFVTSKSTVDPKKGGCKRFQTLDTRGSGCKLASLPDVFFQQKA